MNVVTLILNSQNINPDELAIKKYGTRRAITYKELVSAIIEGKSTNGASLLLKITEPTLESQLYKYIKYRFPTKTAGQKWNLYLLSLINYKQCYKCEKNICFY